MPFIAFLENIYNMVELRWLEKETGKQLQNEWGYFYYETIKILQYRQQITTTLYREEGNIQQLEWTSWMDVPVYNDGERKLK